MADEQTYALAKADSADETTNPPGAYLTFLGVAALAYAGLLVFVFVYGKYGDSLTSGIDFACAEGAYQNGQQQESKGNYELDIQRYRQAMAGRFDDKKREYECGHSIGEVLFRLDRYEEAIDAYRALSQEAFIVPGNWAGYVSALFRANHFEEAERLGKIWLERSVAADEKIQQIWANSTLGQICEHGNRLEEALGYYQSASAIEPEGQASVWGAIILNRLGRTSEAIQKLDSFLASVKSGALYEDAKKLREQYGAVKPQ